MSQTKRDPWHVFAATSTPPPPRDIVVANGWAQYRGWAHRLAADELEPVNIPPPGGSLTAPMPANVLRVSVAEGGRVAAGDVMVVLEAMKMQMSIRSSTAGIVTAIRVREGDVVRAGQVLIEIRGEDA
jgi:biotin carboxyl carrier protein